MLGAEKSSPLIWILPGIVLVAAVLGLLWGAMLRGMKPEIYAGIGRGAVEPTATPEPGFAPVRV